MFFIPKNTGLQDKLSRSCITNSASGADLSAVLSDSRNRKSDKNIIMYKTLQTGANTQSGG